MLDNEGIFILEHADLQSIIKLKMFDTICHEHLEYYSQKVILNLLKKNNLILFDYSKNNINGGSTQYYIKKEIMFQLILKIKKLKNYYRLKENIVLIIYLHINLFLKIFSIPSHN